VTAPRNLVLRGDCVEVMRTLPADSIDAIVTDPPYGIDFMGKDWDGFGTPHGFQTWTEQWAREALRVLKPGGHLLAFGGTRMYHRLATGVEDAGFEVRDMMSWLYGSGFPKSLDVSKAMDKAAGAKRQIVGSKGLNRFSGTRADKNHGKYGKDHRTFEQADALTAPATEDAKRWEGWGTALKPAQEPIVVARKPLIGTVAENVLAHGTGAINIDASRIESGSDYTDLRVTQGITKRAADGQAIFGQGRGLCTEATTFKPGAGRWPANILFDEEAAAELDAQAPNTSRFFYVAKPSKREREAGLHDHPKAKAGSMSGGDETRPGRPTNHPVRANIHPTVKPIALMGYLIKMVTPPGGVVLDPFLGSGSTACAAVANGFDWLGIEQRDEYADIAEARIAHYAKEVDNG
jgi:site-specific DNA-methyltransferase (adenine-specific)